MNVQVEALPNCLATLKVDLPPDAVNAARENITRDYTAQAKLPGYRPGKAPRSVVEKKFQKEIREELERKLLSESTRAAISEKNLKVLQIQNVEDVEFSPDQSLHFTATVVTAPEFELPEYRNIAVVVPAEEVTDAEIDTSIENLRKQAATFEDITGRSLEMEDYAIVDYTGTHEGKPVSETFPKAGKPLTADNNRWVRLTPESFLPGFSEALAGANLNETREFDLTVPADFVLAEMAGKQLHYVVTIKGLKNQILPALDDAFAGSIVEGKTLAELRELARTELSRQKKEDIERMKRDQVMTQLIANVECELPEAMVAGETRRILAEIVQQEQSRGMTDEAIKGHEKELVEAASRGAKNKLKGTFILHRIAEAEKVTITNAELRARIAAMAARYGMTPEKAGKELEKNGAVDRVAEEILSNKVIDFLVNAAEVKIAEGTPAPAV
ncbi:MAG TPA: trigger factor [Chthoniobacteraceae bacterium]|nr:trigger factor [Chthoniobacteraceae bacterium]